MDYNETAAQQASSAPAENPKSTSSNSVAVSASRRTAGAAKCSRKILKCHMYQFKAVPRKILKCHMYQFKAVLRG